MEVTQEGYGRFRGKVSLENNGGFTSTMAVIPAVSGENVNKIIVCAKGDGKRYSLRLKPAGEYREVSYRAYFVTGADLWQEHEFALQEFTPTFRGKVLSDVPPLTAQVLREIGFLIADKQAGPFELLVGRISLGS